MTAQKCLSCGVPFFHEATIGTNQISVKKVCDCGAVAVQPMTDVIVTLTAIRDFSRIPC